jgi:UDP-N-acetylglucosamine 1-carboxyvinyltransferase
MKNTRMMIEGGGPLSGDVQIAGAKNAASKMMIASLLTSDKVKLTNIPLQQESYIAKELVELVGSHAELNGHEIHLQASEITETSTLAQSKKNRLSILLAAPLLHRAGEATIVRLGGDKIGPRPVNFHIDALQRMGAEIEETEEGWRMTAPSGLKGVAVELPYPSVGATETILFAGVLAEGKTVIRNAAVEPEIMGLIMMLQKMGAIIQVGANRMVEIEGVKELHGCEHEILPDRLEAASYACIALATGGEIFCRGARHQDMITFLNAVRRMGGDFEVTPEGIRFNGRAALHGTVVTTDTYPGFSTDWQQPLAVVMTQAEGESIIHETVYSDRFKYTETLTSMGADIEIDYQPDLVRGQFQLQNYRQSAIIRGKTQLKAQDMVVPDIRAGLAYVIAALVADGKSTLTGIEHLERGYEALDQKLRAIGANIIVE